MEDPRLNKKFLSLEAGQKEKLKIEGTKAKAVFTSSRKEVVQVSMNGVVKAKRKGSAIVSAKVRGKKFNCKVQVNKKAATRAFGITLNVKGLMVTVGERYQFHARITPAKAAGHAVSWSSSNPGIVSVDQNGRMTALKSGNAVITASVDGVKTVCPLYVADNPEFEIYLDSYDFGKPVDYVDFTICNYGNKEFVLYNYFIMKTGTEEDSLYLLYDQEEGDVLHFVEEETYVIAPRTSEDLYIGLEEDESFLYNKDSICYLNFWYDGFNYAAVADCDGRLLYLNSVEVTGNQDFK